MIDEKDVRKLVAYPKDFGMIMEDHELEDVIVALVDVKLLRNGHRRRP